MRKICFCFLILFMQLAAHSQEEFVSPSKFITKFPFIQLTGGIILLQAQFDSFPDTLNFILDTGSGGISLDSLTTEYFGLKPKLSNRTIRGIAGMRTVSFINNRKLHFPKLTVDSLNFHVNNYSLLTTVYGEKIDGIIGYSVFSRYIIKLNYDSLHVEFWTKGSIKLPRGGFLFRPQLTTLPIVTARVRDNREVTARFLYDLGAGANLILTTDFVRDSSILHRKRKIYAKQAEGLGGKIDMNMSVVKEVKFGPYRFRNVPVYIFEDEYNVTSYPYLGGLIGNDLLRRFNAIIDYEKKLFHLVPNSHYPEPFDYAYSGIELYYIDGQILIGDVAKGSPAEKCGLLEGDIVIAVNTNFNQNLNQYKIALQNTLQRVKIIVRRNGELQEFSFKVVNILH